MSAKPSQEMKRAVQLVRKRQFPIKKAAKTAGVHWASLYKRLKFKD